MPLTAFDLALRNGLFVCYDSKRFQSGLGKFPAADRRAEPLDVFPVLLAGHELEALVHLTDDDAASLLFIFILEFLARFIDFFFIYVEDVRDVFDRQGFAPYEHHRFDC